MGINGQHRNGSNWSMRPFEVCVSMHQKEPTSPCSSVPPSMCLPVFKRECQSTTTAHADGTKTAAQLEPRAGTGGGAAAAACLPISQRPPGRCVCAVRASGAFHFSPPPSPPRPAMPAHPNGHTERCVWGGPSLVRSLARRSNYNYIRRHVYVGCVLPTKSKVT